MVSAATYHGDAIVSRACRCDRSPPLDVVLSVLPVVPATLEDDFRLDVWRPFNLSPLLAVRVWRGLEYMLGPDGESCVFSFLSTYEFFLSHSALALERGKRASSTTCLR